MSYASGEVAYSVPAHLVKGSDASLVADATRHLIQELVGDDDPSLVVDDLGGDDYEMSAMVDAAQTPPFFGARRIVVGRQIGRFHSDDVPALVSYLANPLPTTVLVLVAGGGQIPRTLTDAVRKVGQVIDAGVPTGRARAAWVNQQCKGSDVRLDASAVARVSDHMGDDVARLRSLLEMMTAVYGPGARLGAADVEPFLGQAGAVAPWDLTDAIDRGDTPAALEQLKRLHGGGRRHPLEIMAILHGHYRRILRLDGATFSDEREAARALGLSGSTFPAKKAMVQARRLGTDAVARAITLLADADLALRGAVEWPPELVLEVLVARLSRLAPHSSGRRR